MLPDKHPEGHWKDQPSLARADADRPNKSPLGGIHFAFFRPPPSIDPIPVSDQMYYVNFPGFCVLQKNTDKEVA